jgi:predicted dehydrogenase
VARFLLGDVADIYARTQRTLPAAIGEAAATMSLRHQSGAISEVTCSYATRIDPDPFPQTLIEIEGREGSLHLKHGFRLEWHRKGKVEVMDVPPERLRWTEPRWLLAQESVFRIQQHFIDRLRDGQPFATSGRDNLKTFALVEAAYASAASGQPVVPKA